ncbi:MAG: cupin domain-containing protein [Gammaproteobacteria bacterium]|nr:cupin domain-containing protein [Gammaproteobacteria bacterium]MBT4146148.1 cupin domain-containing protein [Gammaproteobacteria bacterium]MBT5223119.1 cupin domain-containing protein [Gammaproteobacteria bacterium]MBT5824657.1 cupin domain-containing protein [Gammaproteobacteria bacterium]MBT6418728.1 cupin domain-containing protein [Gammaproteobacteria bacterium]
MQASILPYRPENEFYIDEGCHIVELSNSSEDPDVSIAQARVKAGVTTRWHRLADTVERYVIISGTGLVEVGEFPATKVNPGDTVLIPALCRQRISNTGNQDLIFLAICSPRFTSDCYQVLEAQTE